VLFSIGLVGRFNCSISVGRLLVSPSRSGRPTVSDVFDLYDVALSQTRGRLESRLKEGTDALEKFYSTFLVNHVVTFHDRFANPAYRREIHRLLQARYRTNTLRFWAIDGACLKVDTSDIAIFYGGAYVIKGELGLQTNPPDLQYRESEPGDDSSLVAYLPLSPEDLTMINPEDRFSVNDQERVSTSGLDTGLMLLAENFMCYRGASGENRPQLILWDQSLSGALANATPNVRRLRFAGVRIGGETILYPDLLVGYSKPWNESLDVPSRKSHRLWERAIAKLYASPNHAIDLNDFAQDCGLSLSHIETQLGLLWKLDLYGSMHDAGDPTSLAELDGHTLTLRPDYRHSAEKVERMYQFFCNQLFRRKDPSVLLYEYEDEDGNRRTRFLSFEEIQFLMAVGLRLTFEHCWRNGVMLIGVVKDSASTYFTNHYLGVLRNSGAISFKPERIPSTDRLTFERIPYIDPSVEGPWGSTEFDSVFMTLRMKKPDPRTTAVIQGVRGNVLVNPNIIMRSIIQFHLRREPPMELSAGHAIFVDRLIDPNYPPAERVSVTKGHRELGTVSPSFHRDRTVENREQEIAVYLLSILTRNVFPEVIGYPDPLHQADRGAKAVLHMVEPMLRSSERLNRANPLHRTLRQLRGG
jgi:hypothetical protein